MIILLLICLSGSVLAYIAGQKEPVRTIPVTIMLTVLILYVFAFCGNLLAGVYTVFGLATVVYILFIMALVTRRINKEGILRQLIVPCIPFTVICCLIAFLTRGMLVSFWDEFSHWGDVVKAMYYVEDLSWNPATDSMYASYPPAMSIWEYFVQKISGILHPGYDFVEWRMYLAYQIFITSIFIPLIHGIKKKPIEAVSIIMVFLATIGVFFSYIFDTLMIDGFISLLGGIVFSYVILCSERDVIYDVFVIMSCFTLALSKDVGIVFVTAVGLAYLAESLTCVSYGLIKRVVVGIIPLAVAVLAKMSWTYKISINAAAKPFSAPIDFIEYIEMLVFRNGEYLKQQTADQVIRSFFTDTTVLESPFSIPFAILYFLLTIIAAVVSVLLYKRKRIGLPEALITGILPTVLVLGYSVFIGAMYIYRFGENMLSTYGGLLGYDRYMNIAFLFFWTVVIMLVYELLTSVYNRPMLLVIICYISFIIGNAQSLSQYTHRINVDEDVSFREDYKDLCIRIQDFCEENSKVYLLSRGETELTGLVVHFVVRPKHYELLTSGVSLGPAMDENDVTSRDITPAEWMDELTTLNCDYVAIHTLGEDFAEIYGECFENPNELEDNTVFYFDKNTKKLIRCKYE